MSDVLKGEMRGALKLVLRGCPYLCLGHVRGSLITPWVNCASAMSGAAGVITAELKENDRLKATSRIKSVYGIEGQPKPTICNPGPNPNPNPNPCASDTQLVLDDWA